jgi:hypothetical protein
MLMRSGGAVRLLRTTRPAGPALGHRLVDGGRQGRAGAVERQAEPDNAAADARDLHRSSLLGCAAIIDIGEKEDKSDARQVVQPQHAGCFEPAARAVAAL